MSLVQCYHRKQPFVTHWYLFGEWYGCVVHVCRGAYIWWYIARLKHNSSPYSLEEGFSFNLSLCIQNSILQAKRILFYVLFLFCFVLFCFVFFLYLRTGVTDICDHVVWPWFLYGARDPDSGLHAYNKYALVFWARSPSILYIVLPKFCM